MSICRHSKNSDVYVYYRTDTAHVPVGRANLLVCCLCKLLVEQNKLEHDYETHSKSNMAIHLENHILAGHKVPDYAFEEIKKVKGTIK